MESVSLLETETVNAQKLSNLPDSREQELENHQKVDEKQPPENDNLPIDVLSQVKSDHENCSDYGGDYF